MGFIDDIKFILFYVNEDRQTCLFSATMPPEILRLADEYMRQNKIEHVRLNEEEITDRKSTRLNSSHANISYAVFCLKKKRNKHCEARRNMGRKGKEKDKRDNRKKHTT